jgi:hypothetical protein
MHEVKFFVPIFAFGLCVGIFLVKVKIFHNSLFQIQILNLIKFIPFDDY